MPNPGLGDGLLAFRSFFYAGWRMTRIFRSLREATLSEFEPREEPLA